MKTLLGEYRQAFAIWLRTGRWPRPTQAELETKYNHWHDPDDGRFTFSGRGAHDGHGRGGNTGGARASRGSNPTRKAPAKARNAPRHVSHGASGSWESVTKPAAGFQGNGGDFGGGGSKATLPKVSTPPSSPAKVRRSTVVAVSASLQSNPPSFRTVVRNGYAFQIDSDGNARHISGTLTLTNTPSRSKTQQRNAGGPDRQANDDGGHYIAARFNGPTDNFNHFAQDSNFNRGRYRAFEDQLAKAKRKGASVSINITPIYEGTSKRPSFIDFSYTIDGKRRGERFSNRSAKRGK